MDTRDREQFYKELRNKFEDTNEFAFNSVLHSEELVFINKLLDSIVIEDRKTKI